MMQRGASDIYNSAPANLIRRVLRQTRQISPVSVTGKAGSLGKVRYLFERKFDQTDQGVDRSRIQRDRKKESQKMVSCIDRIGKIILYDWCVIYLVWLRELSFGKAYQAQIRRRKMGRNYVRETVKFGSSIVCVYISGYSQKCTRSHNVSYRDVSRGANLCGKLKIW